MKKPIQNDNRKLILYIASSLDGRIAKPNNDMSFLDHVQVEGKDYGYYDFIKSIDTIILGRKTYEWVMTQVEEYPYKEQDVYVITRTERPKKDNITFYAGDLAELVSQLKSKPGKNIFCDGGAEIVNELLKAQLFDELIISVIPVILGEGIRLFHDGIPEQILQLIDSKSFESGLVQLHYKLHNVSANSCD